MTDNIILEAVQDFLQRNVSPKILLQKAKDNNIDQYELVHPSVFPGWIPPKGFLPIGNEAAVPCIVVSLDRGDDDGNEAGLDIRLTFAVFNPGTYSNGLTYSYEGYKDLINLMFLTRRELSKATIINNITAIEKPFNWAIYQDQPYPYWYGWLTFRTTAAILPYIDQPDLIPE